MAVVIVTKENFDTFVKASPVPVLLDFYADWCGPCRMVSPLVDEIAEERTDIRVGKINVDNDPELAIAFKVDLIPTLAVMKNGEVTAISSGARQKSAILDLLEQ